MHAHEYIRRTHRPNPMSDWGHAMFTLAENEYRITSYGKFRWTIKPDVELVDVDDLDEAIEEAFERYGGPHEFYECAWDVQNCADPEDIVNSAGLWDDPDGFSWMWEYVLEDMNVMAIRTRDGAIVFDRRLVTRLRGD